MRKQFNLEYDDECFLDFCKNDGSMATFNYLMEFNITPTIECMYHIIPFHCSHVNVRNILKTVMEKIDK